MSLLRTMNRTIDLADNDVLIAGAFVYTHGGGAIALTHCNKAENVIYNEWCADTGISPESRARGKISLLPVTITNKVLDQLIKAKPTYRQVVDQLLAELRIAGVPVEIMQDDPMRVPYCDYE